MAMRETERSARLYFVIAGVLGAIYGLWTLVDVARTPARALKHEPVAAIWYLTVVSIVFSALFVIAGLDLPRALRTGARWILRMLVASGIALFGSVIALYLASDFRDDPDRAQAALVGVLVGIAIPIAIIAYLYVNVHRLAATASS